MLVYLIADESGAKGYQDRSEAYPGETGVFAGYLVKENRAENLRAEFAKVAARYFAADAKYHITALKDSEKQAIRAEVFGVLGRAGVACIYEAIHVEGFKTECDRIETETIRESAKAVRRSSVKVSQNKSKESLHQHLFQGLFAKAIAYCADCCGRDFALTILTDRIDRAIFEGLGKSANELLDFKPSQKSISGFDPHTGQVIKGTITTTVQIPASYGMDEFKDASYQLQMDTANSPLVLGADILANSINYIFKTRAPEHIGDPLNDRAAVHDHALSGLFYGFLEHEEGVWMSDAIYAYPEKAALPNDRTKQSTWIRRKQR